jgi:hypothetical protein
MSSSTSLPEPERLQTGSGTVLLRRRDSGESGKDKPQVQTVSPLCHDAELSFVRDLKSKHKFSLAFAHQNQVADNGMYKNYNFIFNLT